MKGANLKSVGHERQLRMQREAMERSRFGYTRDEVMAQKGAKCVSCGSGNDLVIDHVAGGGRHHTERGLITDKTHDMENLQILCRACAGAKDAKRGAMGLGIEGNPNNAA